MLTTDELPDDVDALKALVLEERAARLAIDAALLASHAECAALEAVRKDRDATIAYLQLQVQKMQRDKFGRSSERTQHLLEQFQLALEDIDGDLAEAEEKVDAATTKVGPHTRRQPKRGPLPEHLPRERIVIPAPQACLCCGSDKLFKLGEDVTETLDVIPRQFIVRQTVRERFSCRACETITQPPAPFHVIARGRAGPSLLAMILWSKYVMHLPLTRQAEAFQHEGIPLEVSTMADWVGACAAALEPLTELIRAEGFTASRLHGDDTTVPVLARGKTRTGRLWVYVRDDVPFGGTGPPVALYFYSPDRRGEHPQGHLKNWSGILQADAYGGFNALYGEARLPGLIREASCWAHARRKFFELADIEAAARKKAAGKTQKAISPIALEAVKRIDAVFDIERAINGQTADDRLCARQKSIKPLIDELYDWMTTQRARISGKGDLAKAFDYMLKRWPSFTAFLEDGRICLTNNAAERMIRPLTLGRRNWTFAGSDRGGERAAAIYTLLQTAKLNGVDPQAWLADVLSRIADTPTSRLPDLLPWNWKRDQKPNAI